jgi:putative peptidoglycan lipid II flippase
MLLGAFLQVAFQLPGLRDARLRFILNLNHPTLRRIIKLGLPVLLGLIISQVAIALDRNLASRTGEQSIAWMQYATTIIQFPLGLIAAAISLAILPTLSRQASSRSQLDEFMRTLTAGLRMVLVLTIPATVALFILAEPVIALLFQRGQFTSFDTQQTALALRFYLLGLTFAAIDQPLIFAYYARQNTLTPALVGLLAVGFYLVAALTPTLFRPLQMTDLVLANSVQLTGHALVMLWLVNRVRSLRHHGLATTLLKAIIGALAMGSVLWWVLPLLQQQWPAGTLLTQAILVSILVILGGGVYLLVAMVLRMPELTMLQNLIGRFLPRS